VPPQAKAHALRATLLLVTTVVTFVALFTDLSRPRTVVDPGRLPQSLPHVGQGIPVKARLDRISHRCLECHTELEADLETRGIVFSGSRIANHPVGMSYWNAWRAKPRDLRPAASLSRTISLPRGRVTCISCHRADYRTDRTPLEGECPESAGLTVIRRSLCTSCHRM
jgi:hypothetical protein